MSKVMRSYRLDEGTTETLRETADYLGMSQADVIALALDAFVSFGIDMALDDAARKHGIATRDYHATIRHTANGTPTRDRIRNAIDATAELYA